MSIDVSELKVDSRDYVSIYNDLIAAIPDVSQIWNSTDENDPGIVLVKLMAMYGDMLSYNHDRAVLECYPESVQQRKNAAQIFRLIGYKMRWYRSAVCTAFLTNTSDYPATLPEYTRLSTKDGDIYYTYISSDAIKNPIIQSNMSNSGSNLKVTLIQGFPRTPPFIGTNVIPYNTNAAWHSVYDYNVSKTDVQLGNRLYVTDNAIEESSITLIDDTNEVWTQVDNIDSLTVSGKYFELRVDEYDRPYIELVPYWENLKVSKFKLFYIVSAGENGQITDNAIYRVDSRVVAITGTTQNPIQTDIAQYISVTNEASTYGYNPETPDEARIESAKYINTYDTLVTLSDFEKAVKRLEGVANCVATDKTNDPGFTEDYIGIGDGQTKEYNFTLSRDDAVLYESTDNRFEIYIETVGLKNSSVMLCYCNSADMLIAGPSTDKFVSGTIDKISGSITVNIVLSSPLTSNNYLVAKYHSSMSSTDLRIYVTKTEDYSANITDDVFINSITDNLADKKLMPLDIAIDLNGIRYYEWTVGGTIYLKEKVSLDKAQDIIVGINNALKFKYSKTKIGYNEIISYSDLIATIMGTDDTILNIDIDPIEYRYTKYNSIGDEISSYQVSKEEVSGKFRENISCSYNSSENSFELNLKNYPIKPGSVTLRIMDGRCIINDDNNGGLISNSSVFNSGVIDYSNGKVNVKLTSIDPSYINNGNISVSANYTKNSINMAVFGGVDTSKLIISDDCIRDLYY